MGSGKSKLEGASEAASRYHHSDASVRTIPLKVDTSLDTETRNDQLLDVAVALCPFLLRDETKNASLSRSDLQVKPLEGGLSNELFVIESSPAGSTAAQQTVLVRIHPPEDTADGCGCAIVDREKENKLVAWLSSIATDQRSSSNHSSNHSNNNDSKDAIAPAYYGRFANGRVEEFYVGHETLSFGDMPEYGAQTATLLARMHNQDVPNDVMPRTDCPGDVFSVIDTWLQLAATLEPASLKVETAAQTQNFSNLLPELETEWKWLQAALHENRTSLSDSSIANQAKAFASQIVLAHMDCQSLNLLRPAGSNEPHHQQQEQEQQQQPLLKLIDFEYSGWNARAVDIANTFSEYCDMNNCQADFANEYPSNAAQDVFLQAYVQAVQPSPLSPTWTDAERQTFVDALKQEIGRHTLVSHAGWAIWSLVQHRLSAIDFDYVAYAQHRMAGYRYFQQRFWKESC
jgi:thiamine kinase-like enzyme